MYINDHYMTFDNLCYIHLLKICRLLHCVCSVYQSLNTLNQKYQCTKEKKTKKKNTARRISYVKVTFEWQ